MGYDEEKQRIKNYVTNNGRIIELMPNRSNEKKYFKEIKVYNEYRRLGIRFPGYKTTNKKCDYCVCLVDKNNEYPISHTEIMQDLYNKTTKDNYMDLKRYIEDVARVGNEVKMINYNGIDFNIGFSFQELSDLMFYIAIQEDINYPGVRYQGRKMCFYRYLEAIYCKVHLNHFLDEAIGKAAARGYIPSNWKDVGDLYDNVFRIQR